MNKKTLIAMLVSPLLCGGEFQLIPAGGAGAFEASCEL
jgi:hypothetical protein